MQLLSFAFAGTLDLSSASVGGAAPKEIEHFEAPGALKGLFPGKPLQLPQPSSTATGWLALQITLSLERPLQASPIFVARASARQ